MTDDRRHPPSAKLVKLMIQSAISSNALSGVHVTYEDAVDIFREVWPEIWPDHEFPLKTESN